MKEQWRDIKNFEEYYQISNLGRIKSKDRYVRVGGGGKRLVKSKIIKPVRCMNGYYEASLSCNGKRTVRLLHRVVAEAFIDNPQGLPEVNHKDEDVSNNRVDNLEWCTSKYNANYGNRNMKMREKAKVVAVCQYAKDGKFIAKWNSIADACKETGADTSAIIRVCKGKQKTSMGYLWRYAQGGLIK
jgi:hypothetical protein